MRIWLISSKLINKLLGFSGTGIAFPPVHVHSRPIFLCVAWVIWLLRGVQVAAEQLDQQQLNSSGGGSLFCFLCAGANPAITVDVRTKALAVRAAYTSRIDLDDGSSIGFSVGVR